MQLAQQQAAIADAMASVGQAQAQLTEARENRQDLTVKAPFDGTVVTRVAEPGEVITAGTPVITLLDLSKVYLRGFVPEGQIGKVKVGQAAHVPGRQRMRCFGFGFFRRLVVHDLRRQAQILAGGDTGLGGARGWRGCHGEAA